MEQDKDIWKIVSIICAILSTLFFPPIIGGFGIFAGFKTRKSDEKLGNILIIINIITTIIGITFGLLTSLFFIALLPSL